MLDDRPRHIFAEVLMLECGANMSGRSSRKLILAVVAVIAFSSVAAAQSGRRAKAKSTTPTAPSASEPTAPQSKPQKAPDLQLLVGVEDPSPLAGVPYYFADTVMEECIRRLTEPAGVAVTAGPRRMTRSDAIKAAKTEEVRYVVWLQVGNELADSAPQASASAEEFFVNYLILEPGTAKVKQNGRVQYGGRKVGNVGVGRRPSSRPGYTDYIVREEAREAADRILRAFGIRSEGPGPRE